ncbi:uncharacterized protein LOC144920111 isoform X3 [Branchiostoma floridae x Branchiostoma belcheri]
MDEEKQLWQAITEEDSDAWWTVDQDDCKQAILYIGHKTLDEFLGNPEKSVVTTFERPTTTEVKFSHVKVRFAEAARKPALLPLQHFRPTYSFLGRDHLCECITADQFVEAWSKLIYLFPEGKERDESSKEGESFENEDSENDNDDLPNSPNSPDDTNKSVEDGPSSPDDTTKSVEDGPSSPDDTTKSVEDGPSSPDDTTKSVEDGPSSPDDTTKSVEDGPSSPDDTTKSVEDGPNSPDDTTKSVEDGPSSPDDTTKSVEDGPSSPDDTTKSVEDGPSSPDDTTKSVEDGPSSPDDTTKSVEDGPNSPDDTTKSVEDGPSSPDDTTKSVEDGPSSPDDTTKSVEDGPSSPDDTTKSVEDGPSSPDDTTKSVEDGPSSPDDTTKSVEDGPSSPDDTTKSVEDGPSSPDDTTKSVEDGPNSADDTTKSQEKKEQNEQLLAVADSCVGTFTLDIEQLEHPQKSRQVRVLNERHVETLKKSFLASGKMTFQSAGSLVGIIRNEDCPSVEDFDKNKLSTYRIEVIDGNHRLEAQRRALESTTSPEQRKTFCKRRVTLYAGLQNHMCLAAGLYYNDTVGKQHMSMSDMDMTELFRKVLVDDFLKISEEKLAENEDLVGPKDFFSHVRDKILQLQAQHKKEDLKKKFDTFRLRLRLAQLSPRCYKLAMLFFKAEKARGQDLKASNFKWIQGLSEKDIYRLLCKATAEHPVTRKHLKEAAEEAEGQKGMDMCQMTLTGNCIELKQGSRKMMYKCMEVTSGGKTRIFTAEQLQSCLSGTCKPSTSSTAKRRTTSATQGTGLSPAKKRRTTATPGTASSSAKRTSASATPGTASSSAKRKSASATPGTASSSAKRKSASATPGTASSSAKRTSASATPGTASSSAKRTSASATPGTASSSAKRKSASATPGTASSSAKRTSASATPGTASSSAKRTSASATPGTASSSAKRKSASATPGTASSSAKRTSASATPGTASSSAKRKSASATPGTASSSAKRTSASATPGTASSSAKRTSASATPGTASSSAKRTSASATPGTASSSAKRTSASATPGTASSSAKRTSASATPGTASSSAKRTSASATPGTASSPAKERKNQSGEMTGVEKQYQAASVALQQAAIDHSEPYFEDVRLDIPSLKVGDIVVVDPGKKQYVAEEPWLVVVMEVKRANATVKFLSGGFGKAWDVSPYDTTVCSIKKVVAKVWFHMFPLGTKKMPEDIEKKVKDLHGLLAQK